MTRGQTVRLVGNTFEHRDTIKSLGGVWDAASRSWLVRAGTMAERVRQSQVLRDLERRGVRIEVVR